MAPLTKEERALRRPIRSDPGDDGKTKQSFKDECDINTIMGKFRHTGVINHTVLKKPVYGDFSSAEDYMSSLNAVKEAQQIFDSMPARVRARVDNDPAKFIAFAENPENEAELRELGLIEPLEEREEEVVVAATPPQETANPPGGEEKGPEGTGPTS